MPEFTFFDETLGGKPTNLDISTPPGIGTMAMLQAELTAIGSSYVTFIGTELSVDLAFPTTDGTVVLAEGLESADTLIIDEASKMDLDVAALVEELVNDRSLHGRVLPDLKRVVLVRTRHDIDERFVTVLAVS